MAAAVVLAAPAWAQTYTHTIKGNPAETRVELYITNSRVKIEGHNGKDVEIVASGYEAPPDQAKGLRPVYNTYYDNTNTGMGLEVEGNTIKLVKASQKNTASYHIKLPKQVSLVFQEMNWMHAGVDISNMENEISVKTNSSFINLYNVSGPLLIATTSGNITAVIDKLATGSHAISTVSGFVDITFPAKTKALLAMKTHTGEVYTDLDLEFIRKPDKTTKPDNATGWGSAWSNENVKGWSNSTPPKPPKPPGNGNKGLAEVVEVIEEDVQNVVETLVESNINNVVGAVTGKTYELSYIYGGSNNGTTANLNGGGPPLTIKTVTGDIFLRKAEKK